MQPTPFARNIPQDLGLIGRTVQRGQVRLTCVRPCGYDHYPRQESNTSTPTDQDNPLCRQRVVSNSDACFGTSAAASAAKSGAVLTCPDLQRLVDTWPSLSVVARAAIVAVLDATR